MSLKPHPAYTVPQDTARVARAIYPQGNRYMNWYLWYTQEARQREQTASFRQEQAKRAGIEGAISQGVRRGGMRRSRYKGLAKTHLQHLLTVCAVNMVRVMNWLSGEEP